MIEFVCKLDKAHNSLCQIRQDDKVFYLTEKDLSKLIREMYNLREDAFDETLNIFELKRDLDNALDEVENLSKENFSLRRTIEELEALVEEDE